MFRIAVIIVIALAGVPASAQRVFRAGEINLQQDERLDSIESGMESLEDRMESVESSLASLAAERAPARDPLPEASPKSTEPVTAGNPPAEDIAVIRAAPSDRFSAFELRALIEPYMAERFVDGVFVGQHDVNPRSAVWDHLASSTHGFTHEQVDSLSQDEALVLHDLARNHLDLVFATRSEQARRSPPVPVQHMTITKMSIPGCSPCIRWDRDVRPAVVDRYDVIDEEGGAARYPSFRICIGDSCYFHEGFLSLEELERIEARHGAIAKPVQPAPRQATAAASPQESSGCANGSCARPVQVNTGWYPGKFINKLRK